MSGAVNVIDGLVREYLAFRGFTAALKHLDQDFKVDKANGFKVDKLVEQICAMISGYDLNGLTDLWKHLGNTVFTSLTKFQSDYGDKMEEDVLKLYVANCMHNKRSDKAADFFRLLGPRLHNLPTWKDWFPILYIRAPEEQTPFKQYFAKPWQDAFLTCLHNFLSLAFHQMEVPKLLAYLGRPNSLQNDSSPAIVSKTLLRHAAPPPDIVASTELMDDFYIIAQSGEERSAADKSASKSLKNVFKRRFTKSK